MIMFMLRNDGEVIGNFHTSELDFWDFGVEGPTPRGVDKIGNNHFALPFA